MTAKTDVVRARCGRSGARGGDGRVGTGVLRIGKEGLCLRLKQALPNAWRQRRAKRVRCTPGLGGAI
jgi:hypothetical protein